MSVSSWKTFSKTFKTDLLEWSGSRLIKFLCASEEGAGLGTRRRVPKSWWQTNLAAVLADDVVTRAPCLRQLLDVWTGLQPNAVMEVPRESISAMAASM